MVNKNRIIIGLILIFFLFIFYFLKLDLIFFLIINLIFIYELIYSKIIDMKYLFLLILFVILFFLFSFFIDLIYITIPLLLLSVLLISLITSNYRNLFFSIFIFLCSIIIYLLINIDRNLFYLAIIISFLNDTVAYIFGNLIKGPLIASNISPKKTWSGTTSAVFITSLTLFYLEYDLIISIIIASSLFFGDLYFSYIKRKFSLKDFSNILLSHGGLLDRFDSIFPIAFLFFLNNIFF